MRSAHGICAQKSVLELTTPSSILVYVRCGVTKLVLDFITFRILVTEPAGVLAFESENVGLGSVEVFHETTMALHVTEFGGVVCVSFSITPP